MISIPAEGNGPFEIITDPGEPEPNLDGSRAGNTYTFKPKNIASNIGKAIAKSTGIALGDGLAKKTFAQSVCCTNESNIQDSR